MVPETPWSIHICHLWGPSICVSLFSRSFLSESQNIHAGPRVGVRYAIPKTQLNAKWLFKVIREYPP